MTKNELIKKICYIPMLFWVEVEQSERIKWFNRQEENRKYCKKIKIEETDIEQYLKGKVNLINSWLSYSEDRRGGKYYFNKNNNNYISGYIGVFFNKSKIFVTSKKPETACSNFIINELKLL